MSDIAAQPKTATLIDVLRNAKAAGVDIDAPFVEAVAGYVKHLLFKRVFYGQPGERDVVDKIDIKLFNRRPTLVARELLKDTCMHFIGDVVTNHASKPGLQLLAFNMFGLPFHISGQSHSAMSSCPIPAWLVEVAENDDDANMLIDSTKIEVDLTELGRDGFTIEVTVHRLRPKPHCVGSKNAILRRCAVDAWQEGKGKPTRKRTFPTDLPNAIMWAFLL